MKIEELKQENKILKEACISIRRQLKRINQKSLSNNTKICLFEAMLELKRLRAILKNGGKR